MTLLIIGLVLIGFTFVGLLLFLYMMGHPRPNEPGVIRRIRLHPSAVGEYTALVAHGIFHPHLLRSGATGGPAATAERGNWLVEAIEPNRHLVLYAGRQVTEGSDFDPEKQKPQGMWFVCSWVFVLEPLGDTKTRLMVRARAVGGPAWLFLVMRLVFGYGDTVAHSTMRTGIKEQAEQRYPVIV